MNKKSDRSRFKLEPTASPVLPQNCLTWPRLAKLQTQHAFLCCRGRRQENVMKL